MELTPKPRLAVLAWFFVAPLAGCDGAETAKAADRPPIEAIAVRLAHVSHEALSRPIRASGTLHLKSEADLSFKLGGVLTRVAVDAGARVRKGQLLAAIDPTEAGAAQAQSTEALGKAQRDLQRVRGLFETGAVGQVDVQNAQTALAVAEATAQSAQFNFRQATLLAPDDGIIDRRLVETGEIVAPGRPVFHMRGMSRGVVVRANVTDRDALDLRQGQAAQVRLDAQPNVALPAHVSLLATNASAGTGTFEVELLLDGAGAARLPSGLTAKLEIARNEPTSANVPLAALVDGDGDAAAVYVVQGDRAKRLPVRVSFLAQDRAALASDLTPFDRVVDLGAAQLTDGALVRVTQ